ncbi:hypothetical protein [Thalassolituus alkanivorans]|uniref:hypothetical protein n=1 Tax=Thalassolituus alkanivorans TaxID=2881055 RepID=UPI001E40E2B6|nr:hypothetical protein [Thalassolituus alkanivorans]MCB2385471.1 hypothetical protein [Thalassolituus alkanivorans]MCB2423273.1 hypothetical protein [Thalassolituus alkanivorans]
MNYLQKPARAVAKSLRQAQAERYRGSKTFDKPRLNGIAAESRSYQAPPKKQLKKENQ